jgi:putative flippase GtrA
MCGLFRSRFGRFILTGGIAAAVNVLSRVALSTLLSFRWAVLVAYLLGMITAWILARRFVFERSSRHWSREFLRFGLVNCLALIQVWLISVGLAEWLFPRLGIHTLAEGLAHVIGVASPVVTSYLAHKHFTFVGGRPSDREPQHRSGMPEGW